MGTGKGMLLAGRLPAGVLLAGMLLAGRLLADAPARERVKRELELVAAALGPPGASERTAELVLGLIEGGEEPGEARG